MACSRGRSMSSPTLTSAFLLAHFCDDLCGTTAATSAFGGPDMPAPFPVLQPRPCPISLSPAGVLYIRSNVSTSRTSPYLPQAATLQRCTLATHQQPRGFLDGPRYRRECCPWDPTAREDVCQELEEWEIEGVMFWTQVPRCEALRHVLPPLLSSTQQGPEYPVPGPDRNLIFKT